MPVVEVMSETLASQVAAGEVIERPASVIKELVENSIDAGARKIEVEIQRGGIALMRVRDDGCGMSPDDAARSLERHATSKLRSSDDLNGILTLGFRGEALPSIGSVSRFTMTSREANAVEGTEVRVDGGNVHDPRAIGCPVGTSIDVRDLFFNVPARKKFLKAESTEAAHIEHQLRLHALCAPEIGWVLRKDNRVSFDLPATADRRVRIEAMTGAESGRSLIEVPRHEKRGLVIEGAVLPSDFARRGRKHQYVFLNGRPVEDSVISRALRESFKGSLSEGLQPAAWLWLTMDPTLVDVNVHPAKREVRFRDASQVRIAIIDAVERALRPEEVIEEVVIPPPRVSTPSEPMIVPVRESQESFHQQAVESEPVWRHESQPELDVQEEKAFKGPQFRVIGALSNLYALLEGDEGLVLLSPSSGRERITYEKLLAKEEGIKSQGLLVPVLLELDARDVDVLMRHQEHFEDAGFSLESFGGNTVQMSGMPSFLKVDEARVFLTDLVDSIIDREGTGRVKRMAYEGFAAKVAEAGVKQASWQLSEIDRLLADLFQCDLPYCDPSGRPTLVQISHQELERKFGKS
ncbi:MAG TPA: DNA mismatch repair endonuclease MutL [Verrucomicrobiales bacterium]|nr:DNA mismatch repair endonuclease MutL [Verrucomicrobiales bacterium]